MGEEVNRKHTYVLGVRCKSATAVDSEYRPISVSRAETECWPVSTRAQRSRRAHVFDASARGEVSSVPSAMDIQPAYSPSQRDQNKVESRTPYKIRALLSVKVQITGWSLVLTRHYEATDAKQKSHAGHDSFISADCAFTATAGKYWRS